MTDKADFKELVSKLARRMTLAQLDRGELPHMEWRDLAPFNRYSDMAFEDFVPGSALSSEIGDAIEGFVAVDPAGGGILARNTLAYCIGDLVIKKMLNLASEAVVDLPGGVMAELHRMEDESDSADLENDG